MASTYSQYKIELVGTGEQAGTWGTTTNNNFGSATPGTYQGFEQAIGGRADITMSGTPITLSLTNSNAAQDARALYLNLTGSPGGPADLVVPALQKSYIVKNGSNQVVTVKVTGQIGVAVPVGKTMWLYNNGTDVTNAIDNLPSGATVGGVAISTASGTVTSVDVSGGTTGLTTSGGPVTSSGTITIAGTLAVANGGTGITSLGTGVATFLGTPSSANLAAAVTDETGSGSLVFATSPTLVTPILGTPQSGTLTNATGLPISTGVSGLGTNVATFLGTPSSSNLAAAVTGETGSGALVFATSPTLVTPALGTPSSGTLTNATGLPLSTGVTGTLPVANGGTGATSLTSNNVIIGNGTSAVQFVAPSTSGNVLTSNGTTWTSAAPGGGDYVLLATATASASSSVDFVFPSGYTSFQIVGSNIVLSGSNQEFQIRFSTDGASSFISSGYIWQRSNFPAASPPTETLQSSLSATEMRMMTAGSNVANTGGANFIANINNPGNASYTSIQLTGSSVTTGANNPRLFVSLGYLTATAGDVDAIRFFPASGTISSGQLKLYGKT